MSESVNYTIGMAAARRAYRYHADDRAYLESMVRKLESQIANGNAADNEHNRGELAGLRAMIVEADR